MTTFREVLPATKSMREIVDELGNVEKAFENWPSPRRRSMDELAAEIDGLLHLAGN